MPMSNPYTGKIDPASIIASKSRLFAVDGRCNAINNINGSLARPLGEIVRTEMTFEGPSKVLRTVPNLD
jgi:hypothetical protein